MFWEHIKDIIWTMRYGAESTMPETRAALAAAVVLSWEALFIAGLGNDFNFMERIHQPITLEWIVVEAIVLTVQTGLPLMFADLFRQR